MYPIENRHVADELVHTDSDKLQRVGVSVFVNLAVIIHQFPPILSETGCSQTELDHDCLQMTCAIVNDVAHSTCGSWSLELFAVSL